MTDPADQYDAIVIGAGVIGGAVSFELARRGLRTLTVERLGAAGHGSTSNSCAIVRFSYSTVPGVSLAWEGLHYWLDWAQYLEADDESGLAAFNQCGMLIVTTRAGGQPVKVKRLWDELSIPYEDWTPDELRSRMPLFDHGAFGPPSRPDDEAFWAEPSGSITGGLFSPDAGYVGDPQLACHNLQRATESKGGEYWFGAEVVAIDRSDSTVTGVSLGDGRRPRAPVVVNVAGPHSAIVNNMAGLDKTMKISTRALRHEVHLVAGPADFDYGIHGFNTADDDNGIYFRPELGNNILVGSTDPECDPREYVDPDDYRGEITGSQWEAHVLRLNKRIPALGVPHERRGVVGLYDVSDDWIPVYDRTDLDGFYVAMGTSGNQFKNAGAVGHLMAELITAVQSGHDQDNDPIVVTGRYTGLEIDTAAFARNRAVNANSSMSVHG